MDCETIIREFLNDCDVRGIPFADRNTILRLWSDGDITELSVNSYEAGLASRKGIRHE